MRSLLVFLSLIGQIRDSTVQVQYYGYSYRTNNWYGGSTTNFYVYIRDDDPSNPLIKAVGTKLLRNLTPKYLTFLITLCIIFILCVAC